MVYKVTFFRWLSDLDGKKRCIAHHSNTLPFVPTLDMGFEWGFSDKPERPTEVSWTIESSVFMVYLPDELIGDEDLREVVNTYRTHNWLVDMDISDDDMPPNGEGPVGPLDDQEASEQE
jgi:hypothetical protein